MPIKVEIINHKRGGLVLEEYSEVFVLYI